jgi:hypothetical protein
MAPLVINRILRKGTAGGLRKLGNTDRNSMGRPRRPSPQRELTLLHPSPQPPGRQSIRRQGSHERNGWASLEEEGAPFNNRNTPCLINHLFSPRPSAASPHARPRQSRDPCQQLVHTPRYPSLAPPPPFRRHKRYPSEVHLRPLNSRRRPRESLLLRESRVEAARLKLFLSTSFTPCWRIPTSIKLDCCDGVTMAWASCARTQLNSPGELRS